MKKTILALGLTAALAASTPSCASGPDRLARSFDDWVNQAYSENAWVHGALLQDVLPVYPIVSFAAGIGDLFVNFYYFWWNDAWDNRGTAFDHDQPDDAERSVAGPGF